MLTHLSGLYYMIYNFRLFYICFIMSATTSSFDQTIASGYVNLADERLGTKVHSVSDDFFAAASRMLSPTTPVFHAGKFDDHGQYMDGWESRRKRVAGYDWCIV